MKNYVSFKLQNTNYQKNFLYAVIEHIDDDDYFYNKRNNWEEWLIMREDIKEAIKKAKVKEVKAHNIKRILYVLNKR